MDRYKHKWTHYSTAKTLMNITNSKYPNMDSSDSEASHVANRSSDSLGTISFRHWDPAWPHQRPKTHYELIFIVKWVILLPMKRDIVFYPQRNFHTPMNEENYTRKYDPPLREIYCCFEIVLMHFSLWTIIDPHNKTNKT